MLFVLAGPSYVGKKTSVYHFIKLYSFSSIIPYTTKPIKRQAGEVEGIKYHYVDPNNKTDIDNDNFIKDRPFNYKGNEDDVIYAYKKTDIEQAINSYSNFIIHASVNNAISIYNLYHSKYLNHLYIIFLNYSGDFTKDFFREKFIKMECQYQNETDNKVPFDDKQFERRFDHARKERSIYSKNTNKFDIEIKGNQAYDICESLEKYILPKLMVMPTSPDRIPGALSDSDIVYLIEKRQKDKLCIAVQGKTLSEEEIKKRLSGCGIQLSLSDTIRTIKKHLLSNYINMAEESHVLETELSKIYVEKNISLGYILKPNETVLCSSMETITLPHDVYAIVASKFSYTQLGLSIELGTSVIQSGHDGRIHFQIKNNTENSICIYPEIQVVQLLLFRTIQPSMNNYRDKNDSHGYDKESISPVSKFREGNIELENVYKPGSNGFKYIWSLMKDKFVQTILGFFCTIGIVSIIAEEVEAFLNGTVFPLWRESPNLIKCLGIAFAGVLFDHGFSLIGGILIFLKNSIVKVFIEKTR